MTPHTSLTLTHKLVDALYTEALVLTDEVRTYFDAHCIAERDALSPRARILFSCEAVRVTTRLMHLVTWLLDVRADTKLSNRSLVPISTTVPATLRLLPETATALIQATEELYTRAERLQVKAFPSTMPSPVSQLLLQISAAF